MISNFILGSFIKIEQIFMLVLLVVGLTGCDDYRKDITLSEAQSLVTFPICFPSYIPPGINSDPQINYLSDAANVPEETDIRLLYKFQDNEKKAFEIYQRYTNDTEYKLEYPDSVVESMKGKAEVILIWWIYDPINLSESKLDRALERTTMDVNVFKTNQTVWRLFEINDPVEYRSTMTKWVKDHVVYWIPSYLPSDELKKITLTMLPCSNP